jgi:hypothetical protein
LHFQVIKMPIDFEKIGSKVKQCAYSSLEECLADFILMFDNACKYNEPDSQIYKDALTLQSLAHRTCRSLMRDDDDVSCAPDVAGAVQEILNSVFTSFYNYQDAEERCYSDSLAELPEFDEVDLEESAEGGVIESVPSGVKKKVRALNLDVIKRRLDLGLYKRFDTFQRDVFSVLERARHLSRSDSQIFEDSVELQSFFIKVRANSGLLELVAVVRYAHLFVGSRRGLWPWRHPSVASVALHQLRPDDCREQHSCHEASERDPRGRSGVGGGIAAVDGFGHLQLGAVSRGRLCVRSDLRRRRLGARHLPHREHFHHRRRADCLLQPVLPSCRDIPRVVA